MNYIIFIMWLVSVEELGEYYVYTLGHKDLSRVLNTTFVLIM
jgi:hypothetical protein